MRYLIASLVVMLCVTAATAQQDPMYTQYLHNELMLNPAYTGSRGLVSTTLLYRDQWSGASNRVAPRTTTASVHAPIIGDKVNLGVALMNDRLGPLNYNGINGTYAYRIRLDKSKLAFGVQTGIRHLRVDWEEMTAYQEGDAAFVNQTDAKMLMNLGAGMYFQSKKFAFGVAMPNFLAQQWNFDESNNSSSRDFRHVFMTAAYLIHINDNVKLKPSSMIRYTNGSPINVDATMNLIFADKYWLGATARTDKSWAVMAEAYIDRFIKKSYSQWRIGYAYDIVRKELRSPYKFSHEVFIGFEFLKRPDKVISPRYF